MSTDHYGRYMETKPPRPTCNVHSIEMEDTINGSFYCLLCRDAHHAATKETYTS